MLTQEIQHVSSAIAEKYSQKIQHFDAHSWNLTWLQAALKWTCKSDQVQNDHSD